MEGKKLIKEKQVDNSFGSLFSALRQFKKLSEQEAIIYIEIMKKKQVTVEDIVEILKTKKIKTTTTKPYAIIKNLSDADLLFSKGRNNRNKVYHPINPRDLIFDIKESIKELDDDISLIESEEVEVFQEISEYSEILETEYEITNAVNKLIGKGYKVDFYNNSALISEKEKLFKRLAKNFSLKAKEGKFSVIIASKEDEKIFRDIAIILVKSYQIEQKSTIIGMKIVDPEIFQCLRKGVN